MLELISQFDARLFLFFNASLTSPVLDFLMVKITHPQFWILPGIAGLILYVRKERKTALLVIGLSLVTVAVSDPVSSQVLKPLFRRLRPCHPDFFIEGGRFLLGMKRSFSFPSSHSMNMFAQAALLTGFYPRRAVYFFSFAAVIAYSRVYTGVHFPLDVAGGAVFGIMTGSAVFFTYRLVHRRIVSSSAAKQSIQPISSD